MREMRGRSDTGTTDNSPAQKNDSIAEATMTAALQKAALKVRSPRSARRTYTALLGKMPRQLTDISVYAPSLVIGSVATPSFLSPVSYEAVECVLQKNIQHMQLH